MVCISDSFQSPLMTVINLVLNQFWQTLLLSIRGSSSYRVLSFRFTLFSLFFLSNRFILYRIEPITKLVKIFLIHFYIYLHGRIIKNKIHLYGFNQYTLFSVLRDTTPKSVIENLENNIYEVDNSEFEPCRIERDLSLINFKGPTLVPKRVMV